jgi:DNA mismatch repair protein MutL
VNAIRVLDRSVADRIAAGEVVERPASVVKELVENSLDAGARSVTIEVEGAGLRLIRVLDDGAGIAAHEVPLAFERFATSKIERLEDLDTARSFGFRGEALPSIAAVSVVTMTTRTADAASATRAVVKAGAIETVAPHGAPPGTTVEVARLFFNTPARMKFLKSPSREQALIAEVVQRAALAAPEVAFRLTLDGRESGWWPRGTAIQRAADLLGAGGPADLISVDAEIPGGGLAGWLGRPERGRPTRAGEHLFVNRRPVQSIALRRAVEQGYAQLLPVGRLPVFAVFLEVDPATVDVNVHPRKLEVRFRDERGLFGAVAHHVRQALLASPLVRRVAPPAVTPLAPGRPSPAVDAEDGAAPPFETAGPPLILRARETPRSYAPAIGRLPPLRPLGQLLNTYILAEGPDGLYLVDQHAAHERVLYERIIAARRRGGVVSQTLAVPLALDVTPGQMVLVAGHLDVLAGAGYAVEPFGSRTLLLRALPAFAGTGAADGLLRRVLGALAGEEEGGDPLERLSIATACHTAIRAGDRLTAEAIAALLTDLAGTEDPYTCFHGRPTVVTVPREQLERWFLRG